jgi:hypothetical protein
MAGDTYNYPHFDFRDYSSPARNVAAGDPAPEGTLTTLDSEEIALQSLWAETPVVVEFGSITCPIFVESVHEMDVLAARYADDVAFVMVYTREAHPGARIGPHASDDEKRGRARELREAEGVVRRILVDDVDGTVHRTFDAMPNSVHLVGTDGVVAYRSDWTHPDDLETHLRRLVAAGGEGAAVEPMDARENFSRPTPSRLRQLVRVTRRAGRGSLRDFVVNAPRLALARFRARLRESGS